MSLRTAHLVFLAMLGPVICTGCGIIGISLPGIENRARAAEAAGKPAEAMAHYVNALKALRPQDAELDFQIRKRAIALAQRTRPPLAAPREARRALDTAEALAKKARHEVDWSNAAREYQKGLTLAPWVGKQYYNLGLVQEKRRQYHAAIKNLDLYLLAAPDASDKREVEKKIAELEVEKRKHGVWALEGTWAQWVASRGFLSNKGRYAFYYLIEVRGEELYVSHVYLNSWTQHGVVVIAGKRCPSMRLKLDGLTLTGACTRHWTWKLNPVARVKGVVSKNMDEIQYSRYVGHENATQGGQKLYWWPAVTLRRWTPPR